MRVRHRKALIAAAIALLLPMTAGTSAQTVWPTNQGQSPAVEATRPGSSSLDNYLQQHTYPQPAVADELRLRDLYGFFQVSRDIRPDMEPEELLLARDA